MRLPRLPLLAVSLLLVAASAAAEGPSRGIRLPYVTPALGDEAAGIDINPGGQGLLRGLEAAFYATSLSDGTPAGGQAFYLASPIFGPLRLGLGIQHVSSQILRQSPVDGYLRLSLSASAGFGDRLAFGLSVHRNFADAPGVGDLLTMDLGAVWRPSRWLSLGATVQDVTGPRVNGVPLHRAWVMGVGVRPGTERVFVGADLRIEEVARRVDPSVQLAFAVVPGLLLGGAVEIRDRDGRTEATGSLFLQWSFDAGVPLRGALGYASYVERGRGHDGFTVSGRIYGAREPALPRPSARFVRVHLTGVIPETAPPAGLLSAEGPRWTTAQALSLLRASLRDERVQGVLLALDRVSMGIAQADEIRSALLALRRAGKRVIAHVRGAGNAAYFAATGAERIYLDPVSPFNVVGLSSSVLFLRGLLDKVGVLPEFVAEGRYKSAPEQYTRRSMSPEAKEARLAFLHDAFERLVRSIAKARKKDLAAVRALVDRAPFGPDEAVRLGLADGVSYLDELPKRLAREGLPINLLADPGAPAGSRWGGYAKVAVVHVEGTIADGKSYVDPIFRGRVAGDETVVDALRAARADPRVRAIVLRVNSPGGSGSASDRIWRAVVETRQTKPVVASFGNLAASGGYYVAAGASEIFAAPTTLTGSIGVFFGKVSLTGLLGKLDLAQETLAIGKHANLLDYARPWTAEERTVVEGQVREFYLQFLDRVAHGRKLRRAQVHEIAQGRIWSGAAALRHKLVDRLGGLDLAIERAKELAQIPRQELVLVEHFPRPGLLAEIVRRLRVSGEEGPGRALRAALGAFSSPLLYLRPGEPWALLPFEIEVR